jgi:GT2 family glycosyltransferase
MLYTILVNWKGWEDTLACLGSLMASEHEALTVVVCDNASPDDSVERLTQWADATLSRSDAPLVRPAVEWTDRRSEWIVPGNDRFRFILLENSANLGFAGGNNTGIALALDDPACRYVFILNNDTQVAPNALNRLEAKADAEPRYAIVGATLVFHEQPDIVQGLGARYSRLRGRAETLFAGGALAALPPTDEIESKMDYVLGAAMFVRADILRRTGGLSEDYFLYYEELDLSQQLLPGERLGWAPGAIIRHKVGGSIGTGRAKLRASNTSIYYDHRSKIRFYRTHWPLLTPFLAAKIGKTVLAYIRKGDMVAARVVLRATRDAMTKPESYRADLTHFGRNRRA